MRERKVKEDSPVKDLVVRQKDVEIKRRLLWKLKRQQQREKDGKIIVGRNGGDNKMNKKAKIGGGKM